MAPVTTPVLTAACSIHPGGGSVARSGLVWVCAGARLQGWSLGLKSVLRMGFWWGSIQGGGVPVGAGVMVQWPWWMSRWWCAQSRQPVSRLLGPPAVQGVMWCVSHQEGA